MFFIGNEGPEKPSALGNKSTEVPAGHGRMGEKRCVKKVAFS